MSHGIGTSQLEHLSNPPFDSNEIEVINQLAKSSGLTSDHLMLLCVWMESKEINEENKLKLIECLSNQNCETIPMTVCIRLAWLLKTCNISITTKIELLKWMISAYSFMEASGIFQMLYEYFLGLLKDKEMQPYAAQLIYICTQKKHVTFRRVQYIFRLVNEYGEQPFFSLILRRYIFFCPEYFEDEIIDDLMGHPNSLDAYSNLIKNVHDSYETNFSSIFYTTEENSCTGKFPPFSRLYKQYRLLERSANVSEILKSRLRHLFLTSGSNQKILIRIQDYILHLLHEDIDSQDIFEKHLEVIHSRCSFPGIVEFAEFLSPNHYYPYVAEAICYEPICCFEKISYCLQVIREKLTTEDVTTKCQWLNSLSKMFCYWILQSGESFSCDGRCTENNNSGGDDDASSAYHIASVEISKLGTEINILCESLIIDGCDPFILHQILAHYEMTAIACQLQENPIRCLPSFSIFKHSLFSLTPVTLDSLGRLMLRIKTILGLESSKKSLETDVFVVFSTFCNIVKNMFFNSSYNILNKLFLDIINFKNLNERSLQLKNLFMLHKHPALFLMIMKFNVKDLDENFLIDPSKRLDFLNHVAKYGFRNFIKFLTVLRQ